MKIAGSCAAILLATALSLHGPIAHADEIVVVAPERAVMPAAAGEEVTKQPLFGYLSRPDASGKLPAVVLLHGCPGLGPHEIEAAAALKSWGYVALALDSLGGSGACTAIAPGVAAEVADSYAALRYLAGQDFVDSGRIAVLGFSMGGIAVLADVERGKVERTQAMHFAAAAAYYPWCGANLGDMTVRTLILIGERDDWAPAESCRKMVAHESDGALVRGPVAGKPVSLTVYPGATHAFDSRYMPPTFMGHTLEYNPSVAHDAETRLRAFLAEALGEPSTTN